MKSRRASKDISQYMLKRQFNLKGNTLSRMIIRCFLTGSETIAKKKQIKADRVKAPHKTPKLWKEPMYINTEYKQGTHPVVIQPPLRLPITSLERM